MVTCHPWHGGIDHGKRARQTTEARFLNILDSSQAQTYEVKFVLSSRLARAQDVLKTRLWTAKGELADLRQSST